MRRMWKQKYKLRRGIKESFDYLPSGVCFFDEKGILILCNLKMQQLIFEITGQNLQNICDIDRMGDLSKKDREIFWLKSEEIWSFQKKTITGEQGKEYVQIVASEITELYEKRKELVRENTKLKKEQERIRILAQNIQELTRQEEIINAKKDIHRQMGENLERVRQLLQGEEQ